jgi:hypothetical protein
MREKERRKNYEKGSFSLFLLKVERKKNKKLPFFIIVFLIHLYNHHFLMRKTKGGEQKRIT